MKNDTVTSSKITWTIYHADWEDNAGWYCADGDGLIVVEAKRCGCFVLKQETEFLASFKTLAEALEGGQMMLANDYNEIFQSVRHHKETIA